VPGHPAGDRVDAVEDVDPLVLQQLRQRADVVLCLRDGQPVAGHEDDLPRVAEHDREVLGGRRAHAATVLGCRATGAGLHRPERAEEDVAERPVHGAAHQHRQQRARGADERARHDQDVVVEEEAGCGGRKPRERVQERDHHRHVGATDREHEEDAEHERGGDQPHGEGVSLRASDDRAAEDECGQQHRSVHELLPWIDDRPAAQKLLELRERDQRARERDAADQRREEDRNRFLALETAYLRREVVELRQRDQRDRAAADTVEQRHHLRHRSHLHRAGADDADDGPDRHCDRHPELVLEPLVSQRDRHRERHPGGAEPVAQPGAFRRGEEAQREDEGHDRHQVQQVGSRATHARPSPAPAPARRPRNARALSDRRIVTPLCAARAA
jgi:hypothetical protein